MQPLRWGQKPLPTGKFRITNPSHMRYKLLAWQLVEYFQLPEIEIKVLHVVKASESILKRQIPLRICAPLTHYTDFAHRLILMQHRCKPGADKAEPSLLLCCRAQHFNEGDKNRTKPPSGHVRFPATPGSEKAGSTTSSNSAACPGQAQPLARVFLW